MRHVLGGPPKGRYRLALALALGLLIVAGALGVQAFTLIFNSYEDPVSPPQGTATSGFVVEGGVQLASCPPSPPSWVVNFYFDKAGGGPQIWSMKIQACTDGGKQDTGPSPALTPPPALATPGSHIIQMDVINPQTGVIAGSQRRPYTITGPTLADDPPCGQPGTAVTLTGTGWRPDTTVTITFTPPAGATPIATAVPNQGSTFQTTVAVPNVSPGTYAFVATQQALSALGGVNLTAQATFQVPCVKAAIVLKPTVGPPGTVLTITGTGFPVGALVKLSWSQGIKLPFSSFTIGATKGFFIIQLIYPHDELGPRVMSAAPDLSNPSAPLFNIATANFLVVPGTEQPHDFSWRR